MKIHVPSISESGQVFPVNRQEPWVEELLRERFIQFTGESASIAGSIELLRTNLNVRASGKVGLSLSQLCDRCAQEFQQNLTIDFVRNMVPYFSKTAPSEAEEIELSADDLEFSHYHGEEIDLTELLSEEMLLALPMTSFCQEECRGLCFRCGANLNQSPCDCASSGDNPTSPFAVLKNFQPRKS